MCCQWGFKRVRFGLNAACNKNISIISRRHQLFWNWQWSLEVTSVIFKFFVFIWNTAVNVTKFNSPPGNRSKETKQYVAALVRPSVCHTFCEPILSIRNWWNVTRMVTWVKLCIYRFPVSVHDFSRSYRPFNFQNWIPVSVETILYKNLVLFSNPFHTIVVYA